MPALEWRDVSYSVKTRKGVLRILKHVSGKMAAGTLTAVLGPSGAGKTTLLNLLSGRLPFQSGKVYLNGKKINPRKFRSQFAYVMQRDDLSATSTVKESLRFCADLRGVENPGKKVDELLEQLKLTKCAHVMNGGGR